LTNNKKFKENVEEAKEEREDYEVRRKIAG
jgi:hypothetical protein